MYKMIKGMAISRGIARGSAYVVATDACSIAPKRSIAESEVASELSRLDYALNIARKQLLDLQKNIQKKINPQAGDLFNAQVMLLKDPVFLNQVTTHIKTQRMNVEAALSEVIEQFSKVMGEIQDVYLRERAADVRDLGRRLLSILIQNQKEEGLSVPEGAIIVANELLPSSTAQVQIQKISGFITERGGSTSHAAILARSLGTPAITLAPFKSAAYTDLSSKAITYPSVQTIGAISFGNIKIVRSKCDGAVTYFQDECFHSHVNTEGESLFSYIHVMHSLIRQVSAKRVLMIGCAGGTLATMLHKRGCEVTVLDVNPLAFKLAKKYFQLPKQVKCIVEDGQAYLSKTGESFDTIAVDAFSSNGEIPAHFVQTDFFWIVREALQLQSSLVVMNAITSRDPYIADRIAFIWRPPAFRRSSLISWIPIIRTQSSREGIPGNSSFPTAKSAFG